MHCQSITPPEGRLHPRVGVCAVEVTGGGGGAPERICRVKGHTQMHTEAHRQEHLPEARSTPPSPRERREAPVSHTVAHPACLHFHLCPSDTGKNDLWFGFHIHSLFLECKEVGMSFCIFGHLNFSFKAFSSIDIF